MKRLFIIKLHVIFLVFNKISHIKFYGSPIHFQ